MGIFNQTDLELLSLAIFGFNVPQNDIHKIALKILGERYVQKIITNFGHGNLTNLVLYRIAGKDVVSL